MSVEIEPVREWLEADGLGGFASGTATGIRTRRYHGLLMTATTPPTGRVMLVNAVEVWATTPRGRFALTTHMYAPGVAHPDGVRHLQSFTADPWPTWIWDLGDGREELQEPEFKFDVAATDQVGNGGTGDTLSPSLAAAGAVSASPHVSNADLACRINQHIPQVHLCIELAQ